MVYISKLQFLFMDLRNVLLRSDLIVLADTRTVSLTFSSGKPVICLAYFLSAVSFRWMAFSLIRKATALIMSSSTSMALSVLLCSILYIIFNAAVCICNALVHLFADCLSARNFSGGFHDQSNDEIGSNGTYFSCLPGEQPQGLRWAGAQFQPRPHLFQNWTPAFAHKR